MAVPGLSSDDLRKLRGRQVSAMFAERGRSMIHAVGFDANPAALLELDAAADSFLALT